MFFITLLFAFNSFDTSSLAPSMALRYTAVLRGLFGLGREGIDDSFTLKYLI